MQIPESLALNCGFTELCLRPGGTSKDVVSRTHADIVSCTTISGGFKNLAQARDKGISVSVPLEKTWGLLCESKDFKFMALLRKRAKFSDKP